MIIIIITMIILIIIIKKTVANIVQLAVKAEKSNRKRLHDKSKWIEIKHVVFRDIGC